MSRVLCVSVHTPGLCRAQGVGVLGGNEALKAGLGRLGGSVG